MVQESFKNTDPGTLSEQSISDTSGLKDDFDGALGTLVDKIKKGWMGSEGGVYEVSVFDNHFRFLLRNGFSIPPASALAAEFSGKYPRVLAIGRNCNIQTHGPLNDLQAAWLTARLGGSRIRNIFTETGSDDSSVQVNLKKMSAAEAVAAIQGYLISNQQQC